MSTAKTVSFDKEFILRGRSFIYVMKNKDPIIDCWGTPLHHSTLILRVIV
jgi:hypothetical protein